MDNYTLINKTYTLNDNENSLLNSHPAEVLEDWALSKYQNFKKNLKDNLIIGQLDRCAYCRNIIETDGYYEPLDHVVPKSKKPKWMYETRNIVLTCNRCNNLKKDIQTLSIDYLESENFPEVSDAFKIINPHFNTWSHHLNFEDDLFIVPKPDTKGEETIKTCQLYKYHVITNRAKDLKLGNKTPLERTVLRLRSIKKNTETYDELYNELSNAIDHFITRVQDNPDFN